MSQTSNVCNLCGCLAGVVIIVVLIRLTRDRRHNHAVAARAARLMKQFHLDDNMIRQFADHWRSPTTSLSHIEYFTIPGSSHIDPKKMRALVATRQIHPGETVATYPVQLIPDRLKYDPTYALSIYDRIFRKIPGVVGIPTPKAFEVALETSRLYPHMPPPIGQFANEPCIDHIDNAVLKFPSVSPSAGLFDVVWANLKAIKLIQAGEHIVWCYGPLYPRSYATSCAHPERLIA